MGNKVLKDIKIYGVEMLVERPSPQTRLTINLLRIINTILNTQFRVVFILLYQSILNFGGGAVMSWSVRIVGVFLGMVCVGQNVMRLYDIPMPM